MVNERPVRVIALLLSLVTLTSCATVSLQLYDGPQRPNSDVSIVRLWGPGGIVQKIDGKDAGVRGTESHAYLLRGDHTFELKLMRIQADHVLCGGYDPLCLDPRRAIERGRTAETIRVVVNHCPMSETTIRLSVDGPVARLTFDRPHVLNAGNSRFATELAEAVAAIAARPDVRVVVMTGAGRAFQTGVDLKALAAGELTQPDLVRWEDAMTALERMDKLVIAGINGHAIGGGLQLALVCDYRLAVEDALLSLPAVKECLIPSMSLYRLPRLIGMGRAKELILLGEPITAREGERIGLVNRAVPAADFPKALDEIVDKFLALPPVSVTASKRLSTSAFDLDFETFRREMNTALAGCFASDEHQRAMANIRSKKRS
jgi:enoyl-CoA hydratase/carnithine racemase